MTLTRKHFYFDPVRHAVHLAWLKEQTNQSEAMRDLIEAEIARERGGNNSQPPPVDVEEFRQVIREELARVQIHSNTRAPEDTGGEDEEVTELMGGLVNTWNFDDQT